MTDEFLIEVIKTINVTTVFVNIKRNINSINSFYIIQISLKVDAKECMEMLRDDVALTEESRAKVKNKNMT